MKYDPRDRACRIVTRPSAPLRGALRPPGDKSIAHRALILGTLAEGTLAVRGLPAGLDVASTRRCLEALGGRFEEAPGRLLVHGVGLSGLRAPARPLDCGNSGTTMRLLAGVLAGQPFTAELTGDASLSRRPMRRVAEPLRLMGAELETSAGGTAPLRVRGRRPLAPAALRLPVPSAQVKSAVLLAALFADGESSVDDPFATRDHTERMLSFLSAGKSACRTRGERITISPRALRSGKALTVPGDPSTAAFFAAAAALVPGSRVLLERVLLNPGRLGFFRALRELGARVESSREAVNAREPIGDLEVAHAPLRALRLEAARVPALIDEVPVLAVLAAAAEGESRLEGLGELRHKESDRLAATAAGLRAMGADARVDGDALVVRGPARLKGAEIDPRGDHRLAMAFAVAGLAADGETRILDPGCAAVSHPGFWEDLAALGAPVGSEGV